MVNMEISEINSTVFKNNYRNIQDVDDLIQEHVYWMIISISCLILIGKIIQELVFIELQKNERQNIRNNFCNFIFCKIIFVFGVLDTSSINEVALWCNWFLVHAFLHLLIHLSRDRFEYLSFSPRTSKWIYIRLLVLLSCILSLCLTLFAICVYASINADTNTLTAFIAVECMVLNLKIIHVITRYGIYFKDLNHEERTTSAYFLELVFEVIILSTDFLYHLLMLGNFINECLKKVSALTACLLMYMQLRYLYCEIKRRISKHINYLSFMKYVEKKYPVALLDQLNNCETECAICLDSMGFARKLPCGHLFHTFCLGSWLEQNKSCPNCRALLDDDDERESRGNSSDLAPSSPRSKIVTWLFKMWSDFTSWHPSLSFEASRIPVVRDRNRLQTTRLDSLVQRVLHDRPFLTQIH